MLSSDIFVFYITSVILGTTVIICTNLLAQKKLETNCFTISILLVGCLILMCNNLYNFPLIKNFCSYLIFTIIISLIYKINIKSSVINYFPLWALVLILNTILSDLLKFSGLLNMQLSPVYFILLKIGFTLIDSSLLFIIVYIKSIREAIINTKNLLLKKRNLFILTIIFLIITLLNNYSIPEILFRSIENVLPIVILGLVVVGIIVLINLKNEEILLESKNKHLNDTNEFYDKLVEGYSLYNHNVNNQFLAMRAVANPEVKKLIDRNLKILQINSGYLPLFQKAPKGIKEILYVKFSGVDHNNILINIENECDDLIIENVTPKAFNNLLEAIGIAVDNAIEAECINSKKIINININNDENKFKFCITNNFTGNLDIEKLGEYRYTTKTKGQGIGLYYLLNHKLIKYENKIINNSFLATISIKLKTKQST